MKPKNKKSEKSFVDFFSCCLDPEGQPVERGGFGGVGSEATGVVRGAEEDHQ